MSLFFYDIFIILYEKPVIIYTNKIKLRLTFKKKMLRTGTRWVCILLCASLHIMNYSKKLTNLHISSETSNINRNSKIKYKNYAV